MEKWLPNKEFPNYHVSNKGRVKNANTGRVLQTYTNDKGYQQVSLSKEGKRHTRKIQTLVSNTFHGPRKPGFVITHKNGKRSDCEVDNLEYKTRPEAIQHSYTHGRKQLHSMKAVRCVETGKEYESIVECSKDMNISVSAISRVLNGRSRHTVNGYHFENI